MVLREEYKRGEFKLIVALILRRDASSPSLWINDNLLLVKHKPSTFGESQHSERNKERKRTQKTEK